MIVNLREIEKKTTSANQYIDDLEQPIREKFSTRKQTYALHQKAINQLKQFASQYMLIAFSAQWCKDCATNIPVLALISEATGLKVRVFSGLKKDPLSQTQKWRIPPSPPEVQTFNADKLPLIVIMDNNGNEIGRIVENPKLTPSLEQELCKIIKTAQ
jgi:hypothetical protein